MLDNKLISSLRRISWTICLQLKHDGDSDGNGDGSVTRVNLCVLTGVTGQSPCIRPRGFINGLCLAKILDRPKQSF